MAKRRRRRSGLRKLGTDVLSLLATAREVSKGALQQLRKEIGTTRRRLEKLVDEERGFRLDLFGAGGRGRHRAAGKPRKSRRVAGGRAAARRTRSRRKGPPKADKFLTNLPPKFTIDDVRKIAGKAAPISLAQWTRAKKIKKVASGYQKVA